VVRVGITGHRWNKLRPADGDALRRRIRAALDAVMEIAGRVANDPRGGYRDPAANTSIESATVELRLISALAEGADRLLVEVAPSGAKLQAILPFPVESYAQDFSEPDSTRQLAEYLERARREAGVVILDGDRAADNAFEAVGTAVCLNSDVLIAIWDGLPGQPGGTSEVVELATRIGVPVLRLVPDGSRPPWLDQPERADRGRAEEMLHLEERLRRLFMPPEPPAEADEDELDEWHRLNLRERYFAEAHRSWQRGRFYAFMVRLLSFSWRHPGESWRQLRRAGWPVPRRAAVHYGEAVRQRWTRKWKQELGLSGECVDGILASSLPEHYGWVSHLASYYAGRYRNAYLWAYLLSWFAVFGAAAGLVAGSLLLWVPNSTVVTAVVEVGLLLIIVYLIASARHGKFHERWLAYRSLTEGFRSLTYTLPLGRASTLDARRGAGGEHWGDWLHRAVVREVGQPPAVMSTAHLAEARTLLLEDVLREQIDYHARNAATLGQVGRRLHRWTEILFFVALALSLHHLYEALEALRSEPHLYLQLLKAGLGVLGISLPGAAAAVHGFLSQAEFEPSANRSRRTRRELERLRERGLGAPLSSVALGEVAAEAAQAMHGELGAWFAAYHTKGLSYP
jgi:hypothetical protein